MIRGKHFSTVFCQPELCSEETLRRGCTQADNELGSNGSNLRFQPGAAGRDLKRIWLLMEPNFSAWFPLEMLNGIGDVDIGSIDTCGLEAFIEQLPGRTDEGLSLLVFAISGLFPHQENSGMGAALAKYDLRGFPIEVATATLLRCFP
jgi:hypothetical protein